MYRWGFRENHSYVLYAGFSKHQAIVTGSTEQISRGDKYSPEVVEFTPGDVKTNKVVYSLEQNPDFKCEKNN